MPQHISGSHYWHLPRIKVPIWMHNLTSIAPLNRGNNQPNAMAFSIAIWSPLFAHANICRTYSASSKLVFRELLRTMKIFYILLVPNHFQTLFILTWFKIVTLDFCSSSPNALNFNRVHTGLTTLKNKELLRSFKDLEIYFNAIWGCFCNMQTKLTLLKSKIWWMTKA